VDLRGFVEKEVKDTYSRQSLIPTSKVEATYPCGRTGQNPE